MNSPRPVAVLLGAPGSGKSTQVRLTATRLGWHAVDFGHLVRSAVKTATPLGARVVAKRKERAAGPHRTVGAWLPDPLCRDLLNENLAAAPQAPGVLFEGYPRLRDQAPFLEQLPWRLVVAIHLVVPTEQRRQRLDQRVLDRETGRVGRASQASSETSIRRPEDAPESLAARLIDWERDTLPLLEHYRAQALLLDVNGVGPEEEITHRIAAAINGRL